MPKDMCVSEKGMLFLLGNRSQHWDGHGPVLLCLKKVGRGRALLAPGTNSPTRYICTEIYMKCALMQVVRRVGQCVTQSTTSMR